MDIKLKDDFDVDPEQIIRLYELNKWSSANKPKELINALTHSHSLVTAWREEKLVGLGNAISDGHLVVYYPHLLVDPLYQKMGIGRKIIDRLREKYSGFHQHILVADYHAIRFYEKCGFEKAGLTHAMWIYEGDDH